MHDQSLGFRHSYHTETKSKFKSQKLHSIADATETFIQTPKDHLLQRLIWSNYKHHNT